MKIRTSPTCTDALGCLYSVTAVVVEKEEWNMTDVVAATTTEYHGKSKGIVNRAPL